MAKQKLVRNAPLESGDNVICLKMDDDYGIPSGTPGVVKSVSNVFGGNQYNVKWMNGSVLALIDGVDQWLKVVKDSNIEENIVMTKKEFLEESTGVPQEFIRLSKYYTLPKIKKFFDKLRESGVINMITSPPYLYMGKERIAHEHHYDNMNEDRQESFDELLEMAEDVRNEMIRGAMKRYISNDKSDDNYMGNLERTIKKDAQDLFMLWTKMKGGSRAMR